MDGTNRDRTDQVGRMPLGRNGAEPQRRARVAILGTGKMGSAIAERLAGAGFELTIWNRTRSRAEALRIGRVVDTPAAAARDAAIVISSLTGPDAVRSTYVGPDGALDAGSGRLFIEMSTAGADLEAELVGEVGAAGGRLVDAPILGAPPIVREGKAAILLSGARRDVATATPVLETLGTVKQVGPLGSAARLKLVANSMLADLLVAAAELQVAGEEAGLDRDDVFWVLQRLVPGLEPRRRGYLEGRHGPAMFAMRDLLKDLDFAKALFDGSGRKTPLTALARSQVADVAWESPDLDVSAVIKPYRAAAARQWNGWPPAKGPARAATNGAADSTAANPPAKTAADAATATATEVGAP
jgi:3-hydroxyisobutyrate dehydrogenase-like beta-hydroxyacid dehydrogenase